jgi:hypothetical protein
MKARIDRILAELAELRAAISIGNDDGKGVHIEHTPADDDLAEANLIDSNANSSNPIRLLWLDSYLFVGHLL